LVGTFKLKSEVSRKVVAAGESVTLSTTVSGPATAIPEPSVDVSDDFKVYDDKPATSTSRRPRGLTATKVFRKALVPSTPGLATIGPVKLVVYDTERASYRTLIQGPFRIEVIEGSGDDALNLADGLGPAGKRSVRVLGDDLLPNRTGLDALPFAWGGRATALRGGALLGPPGLYLALLLTLRRREHYASSAGLRRRKGALKRARAALKGADALSVTATLRAYVGDKLDREGKALTAHEVADLLAARGVGQAEIDRVAVVLRWETEFQYGGGSNADPEPMRTEVADLLTQLDRVLR
jgi:hypothetical protein